MIKQHYIVSLFAVFMLFKVYSQHFPRTVVLGQDTCIAFTLDQSKEMAKWNEERKENYKLYSLCAKQIIMIDSVVTAQALQLDNMGSINRNFKDIIGQKDELLLLSEAQKKSLVHEVKIQKRQKWIAIGLGILSTAVLTIITIR